MASRKTNGSKLPLITSWKRVRGIQNQVLNLATQNLALELGHHPGIGMVLHLEWLCGLQQKPFLDEEPLTRHPELEEPTWQDRADQEALHLLQIAFFNACIATPDSGFAVDDECRQVVRGRTQRFFQILLDVQHEEDAKKRQERANSPSKRQPKPLPSSISTQLAATGLSQVFEQQRQRNKSALTAVVNASGNAR